MENHNSRCVTGDNEDCYLHGVSTSGWMGTPREEED